MVGRLARKGLGLIRQLIEISEQLGNAGWSFARSRPSASAMADLLVQPLHGILEQEPSRSTKPRGSVPINSRISQGRSVAQGDPLALREGIGA